MFQFRLGSNRDGYGRERLCQEIEPQRHLESERLRAIRKATSLSDLYRLCGSEYPSAGTRRPYYHQTPSTTPPDGHVQELKAQQPFSNTNNPHRMMRRRQSNQTNPISDVVVCAIRNRVLTSKPNDNDDDLTNDAITHLMPSRQMRQTNLSKILCPPSRSASNHQHHQPHTRKPLCLLRHEPHSKSSPPIVTHLVPVVPTTPPSPSLQRRRRRPRSYSFCNNPIIDAEEPLKRSIEHELHGEGENDNVDGENLEWFVRLASRCYRDGFQWHADYLRGKGTQLLEKKKKKQLLTTRRPLQLHIERHLEDHQQNNKTEDVSLLMDTQRQWSSTPLANRTSPFVLLQPTSEVPRSTIPENKREYEIRIQINPTTTGQHHKYPLTQQQAHHKSSSASAMNGSGDKTIISHQLPSEVHKPDIDLCQRDLLTKTAHHQSNNTDLIDDFATLNISTPTISDPSPTVVIHHHQLPQIVLTDCCANNYDVCNDDG